jgi:hypothetical protein
VALDQEQRELSLRLCEPLAVVFEFGLVCTGFAEPLPLRDDAVDLAADGFNAVKSWVACHGNISSTQTADLLGYHRQPCASC